MVQKKQEYARKLKEYERQKTDDLKDLREIADAEKSEAVKEFEKKEKNLSAASKGEFFQSDIKKLKFKHCEKAKKYKKNLPIVMTFRYLVTSRVYVEDQFF